MPNKWKKLGNDLTYMFVTHDSTNSAKESKISDFLNEKAVFQIHLSSALLEIK